MNGVVPATFIMIYQLKMGVGRNVMVSAHVCVKCLGKNTR